MRYYYKVLLLEGHTAQADQIVDGYLGNSFGDGKVELYDKGEAYKKAYLFRGKAVKTNIPIPPKEDARTFLLYKTDSRHSYASRDLIGVATSKEKVIALCKQQAKKEGEKFDSDQLFNLNNISQTQGYSGHGEFHFEEVKTNILL